MATITPKPDILDKWHLTGSRWMRTLFEGLERVPRGGTVTLALGNLDWIHLFEWTSTAALIASRLLSRNIDLNIDLTPQDGSRDMTAVGEFLDGVRTLAAFSEISDAAATITSPPLTGRRHTRMPTVLMGLMRIRSESDALQYLDQKRIDGWRAAMALRFPDAPLLEHEALWRLLCFELTSNIAEHAGDYGYLSAHIIQPKAYLPAFDFAHTFRERHEGPFLNLCVADSGRGLIASLEAAYRTRHGLPATASIVPTDVVAFAFHEIGSRKDFLTSWVSDRHALSRCLRLVEQYGGVLRIRSAGLEFHYDLSTSAPTRRHSGFGYTPTAPPIEWAQGVPGTHIQVLLPLKPRVASPKVSPLRRALPSAYSIEEGYPVGHYVPLSCYFSDADALSSEAFVDACRELTRILLAGRPADEPIVFDFHDVRWTRRHVETFVVYLENVLSRRAALFIRVPVMLATELAERPTDIAAREMEFASMLWHRTLIAVANDLTSAERAALAHTVIAEVGANDVTVTVRPELLRDELMAQRICNMWRTVGGGNTSRRLVMSSRGEREFRCESPTAGGAVFEGIHDVWDTILVLDVDGVPHALALEGEQYSNALTSLIHTSAAPAYLAAEFGISEPRLVGILLRCQPLFIPHDSGTWSCCWDEPILYAQAHRSAVVDFADVVALTGAWRGRAPYGGDRPHEVFYLPWEHKWLDSFLECGRIFGRERYVDEIAQRLVATLRRKLSVTERQSLSAFIAVTTPSLVLAKAIGRWWQLREQSSVPIPVLDIGDYVFGGSELPTRLSGVVVIVQDVLNTGLQTNAANDMAKAAGATATIIVTYVSLTKDGGAGLVGTTTKILDTPVHALVTAPAPNEIAAHLREPNAFLVEPRTIRPISGQTFIKATQDSLLREGRATRVAQDMLSWEVQNFDRRRPLIRAGHFVVGRRHHTVTLDVRALCRTELGAAIAKEVAEICLGIASARKGNGTQADISAVLMPLDSDVSYLWPQIHDIVARSGRRQPFWFLEVTSELGDTPVYLTPRGLLAQARHAVSQEAPLRLLVLDDAIISGATAHQTLVTVQYAADRANRAERPACVESVLIYSILDRQSRPEHRFSDNVRQFGDPPFQVAFQSPLSLLGPRPFLENTCPACDELQTIERVRASVIAEQSPAVLRWCDERRHALEPVAIELGVESDTYGVVSDPIIVTDDDRYGPYPSADLAITRFQQLMSGSYPVVEVLERLTLAVSNDDAKETRAHDRYRWSVLSWCLRHWSRYTAFPAAGRQAFSAAVSAEIASGSALLPSILAECARRESTPEARQIFLLAVDAFADLDAGRLVGLDANVFRSAVNLETALLVFLAMVRSSRQRAVYDTLISEIAKRSTAPGTVRNRVGLRRLLNRASGAADTKPRIFSLESIAETVCRERRPDFAAAQAHDLLPKLLARLRQDAANEDTRHFTGELLALFIKAAETLDLYTGFFSEGAPARALAAARAVSADLNRQAANLSRLDELAQEFEPLPDRFISLFSNRFNSSLGRLRDRILAVCRERSASLSIEFGIASTMENITLLTDVIRLTNHIANITVDPAAKQHLAGPPPVLETGRIAGDDGRDRIVLTIKTCFVSGDEVAARMLLADNYKFDAAELEQWGVAVAPPVTGNDGWSVFTIRVPVGFPHRTI